MGWEGWKLGDFEDFFEGAEIFLNRESMGQEGWKLGFFEGAEFFLTRESMGRESWN